MFNRLQLSAPAMPGRNLPRLVASGASALLLLAALGGSYFVVDPTEMAGVRRLGIVTSTTPIGPGIHLKVPFIDQADHLQVSLTTFQVGDLSVYTIDNQAVRIGVGLNYRIPATAVFKLLYTVGRSGNVDIDANIRPIVADRALRVFARRNTISISSEREAIANEIRRAVQEAVADTFGIEIVDLQLSRIEYSPAFTQSVEAAVRAKNEALQAENTVARIRYEGEQTKVQAAAQAVAATTKADGEAQAAVTRARGERQATVLRAEGEAQATTLLGQAQAAAVQLMGTAVAANPRVVDFETAKRWNGMLPATMLGGGAVPLITLPATLGAAPGR